MAFLSGSFEIVFRVLFLITVVIGIVKTRRPQIRNTQARNMVVFFQIIAHLAQISRFVGNHFLSNVVAFSIWVGFTAAGKFAFHFFGEIKDATYVRGFLGRMLFTGEDGVKKMRVLSGGEKVRVLLSRMMIMGSNVLMFDEPTDHLDMESITALNNGMIKFPGVILFACRDHQVVQTTANRIIEFLPNGSMIDKITTYDEYLDSDEMARKRQVYSMSEDDEKDN